MSEDGAGIWGFISFIIIFAFWNFVMNAVFPTFSAIMQSLGDTVREIGIGWMEPIIDGIPKLVWVGSDIGGIALLIKQIKKGME